jgi:hypothetical protein
LTGAVKKVSEMESLVGAGLSKNDIQHFSKHIPAEFANQAKHFSADVLQSRLNNQTFFNPSWSKDEIINYVNEAYTKLREQGVTGLNSYTVKGETIMLHIKPDGKFSTAYGLHKLPVSHFIK